MQADATDRKRSPLLTMPEKIEVLNLSGGPEVPVIITAEGGRPN